MEDDKHQVTVEARSEESTELNDKTVEQAVADLIQRAEGEFNTQIDAAESVSYTHLTLPTICSV